MDNSGYFTATSCSDKTLSLYEFDTGECMATMSGHSGILHNYSKVIYTCYNEITRGGEGRKIKEDIYHIRVFELQATVHRQVSNNSTIATSSWPTMYQQVFQLLTDTDDQQSAIR